MEDKGENMIEKLKEYRMKAIIFEDGTYFGGVINHTVISTDKINHIKEIKTLNDRDFRYLQRYKKQYRYTEIIIEVSEIKEN